MGITTLITFLIAGAVAGWLAGVIMDSKGFGVIGNIVFGILGAIAANLVLGIIGISTNGFIVSIIAATAGAAFLLHVLRLIK